MDGGDSQGIQTLPGKSPNLKTPAGIVQRLPRKYSALERLRRLGREHFLFTFVSFREVF
jgi:hypothetical protein